MSDAHIKIDCAQIPRVEMRILSHTLLDAIERFYDDPENLRRFNAWQQKRMAKRAVEETVQQSMVNGG